MALQEACRVERYGAAGSVTLATKIANSVATKHTKITKVFYVR
jgi:hypothetical protein